MRLVKLALLLFLLPGCSSTQKISGMEYSLVDIQKGIAAVVPKGIAKISPNGRTHISRYFDPESIDADRSTERSEGVERERATVICTILGDRRPYTIEIDVLVEEDESGAKPSKNDDYLDGTFDKVGYDKKLALYFKNRLANYLAKLERNKNLIDDFRPF